MKAIQRAGLLLAATLLSIYLYMALKGPQGIPALYSKWSEIRDMQLRNAELAKDVRMREQRISRISKESDVLIRERLKLQRPGETTFILEGEDGTSVEPPPQIRQRPRPAAVRPAPSPQGAVSDDDVAEGTSGEVKPEPEAATPVPKPSSEKQKPAETAPPAEQPQSAGTATH